MAVVYSINGKSFKDYGVSVSQSLGIADMLKRKEPNSYDWAEYHGISVDLSNPKFEARELELRCYIKGSNWQDLFDKFNTMIRNEFSKSGTQRLLILPMTAKALPYEVFLSDDIKVEKRFKDGAMHATFSLKMIEPNPIKKVYLFKNTFLNLSYTSPQETEIFFGDGTKSVVPGNASIVNKELPAGDKYIIIAGNVDQITNIVTNATLVWDKL